MQFSRKGWLFLMGVFFEEVLGFCWKFFWRKEEIRHEEAALHWNEDIQGTAVYLPKHHEVCAKEKAEVILKSTLHTNMLHGTQRSEIKTEYYRTKLPMTPESKMTRDLLSLDKLLGGLWLSSHLQCGVISTSKNWNDFSHVFKSLHTCSGSQLRTSFLINGTATH